MVMNADGSNQAVIYEWDGITVSSKPSWSPDGNSIAWSHAEGSPYTISRVWRIDVEVVDGVPQGTNLQQLVIASNGEHFSNAVWSPFGNEIAYLVNPYSPYLMRIDGVPALGGLPYTIYTAPEGQGLTSGLAWSSDGTQLATIGGEMSAGVEGMSIMIIDRATGTVTHNLLTGQFDFARVDWARQGSNELVFHDKGGLRMIYKVDIDTETVVLVVEGSNPSWSPDNSMIVYFQPESGKGPNKVKSGIRTYEFSTGEITLIASPGKAPDWRRF
jgi:Tol biopolymer transport system component